jgi:hypothetical protein
MSPTNTPDQSDPWCRLPSESAAAHSACLKYLELGERRSLSAVAAAVGKSEALVARWSSANAWGERARAFDEHRANLEQAARDRVLESEAEKWERRRLASLDADYEVSEQIREKVREMLRESIHEVKWTFPGAAQMAKVAAELGHACVDAATIDDELSGFDPATATPEQAQSLLDRFAARKKAVRNAGR